MKYLHFTALAGLFCVLVFGSGFSLENHSNSKGIYYDHVRGTDNVVINQVSGLNIDYTGELNVPGDSYELVFDVINDSTVDVQVEDCIYGGENDYIDYDFSYLDGGKIHKGDVLKAGEEKSLIFRVSYVNPITIDSYQFDSSFSLHYEQVL